MRRCTNCNNELSIDRVDFIAGLLGLDVNNQKINLPVSFCSPCATGALDAFKDELAKPRSESRSKNIEPGAAILRCSFCHRDQFARRILVSFCRYYQTALQKGTLEVYPVVHDRLFIAAHQSYQPQKVGEAYICDECLLRSSQLSLK